MSVQLINTILRDIDTLTREIHALYELKFKNYDLHRGQFLFLTRVYENPGITLGNLSYELKMDKTTITRAIQKLIDYGYVYKEQNINDKRMWHLYASEKCNKLYSEIVAEKNRIISMCFDGIDPEDIAVFSKVVSLISDKVNNEWEKLMIKNTSFRLGE